MIAVVLASRPACAAEASVVIAEFRFVSAAWNAVTTSLSEFRAVASALEIKLLTVVSSVSILPCSVVSAAERADASEATMPSAYVLAAVSAAVALDDASAAAVATASASAVSAYVWYADVIAISRESVYDSAVASAAA